MEDGYGLLLVCNRPWWETWESLGMGVTCSGHIPTHCFCLIRVSYILWRSYRCHRKLTILETYISLQKHSPIIWIKQPSKSIPSSRFSKNLGFCQVSFFSFWVRFVVASFGVTFPNQPPRRCHSRNPCVPRCTNKCSQTKMRSPSCSRRNCIFSSNRGQLFRLPNLFQVIVTSMWKAM